MQLTISFDPATEVGDVERLISQLEHGELVFDAHESDPVEAILASVRSTQQDWMRQRADICREAGLHVTATSSTKYRYLLSYDPVCTRPNTSIVTVLPERAMFILPAMVADEYDSDEVYRTEHDERVGYRGKDPELFEVLLHRTVRHMRG